MRSVRRENTAPELSVRSLLHSAGYRFRLHGANLPGRPDLVFRRRKKAIFVHGCFWHAHDCRASLRPKSRGEFWNAKLERNRARDRANVEQLESLGWSVLCVWECETGKQERGSLLHRLRSFLGPTAWGKPRK
jgi:DNA mismatch endonuclease, patch repair protein